MRPTYLYSLFLLIIISCNERPKFELDREGSYYQFSHVKELVDEDNITIGYEKLEDTLTVNERNMLVQILKEYNWKFKVSTEGDVLISILGLNDLKALGFLDGELNRRLKEY